MRNPAKHSHYPASWARSVAKDLYRAHTRATEIVWGILGLNLDSHAKYLQFGDPMWPKIRDMIHEAEKRLVYAPYEEWSMLGKANFLETCIRIGGERAYRRLDSLKKLPNLKEQGFRGESGGKCDGAPQIPPSFFRRVTQVTGRPHVWELD